MRQISRIMWGFVLIILGVVFSLNALEITDIDLFFKGWWTLLIIVPSFISLFTDNDKIGGFIGLGVGLMLLLACRGYFDIKVICKLIVPLIIIIVGFELVFKDAFDKEKQASIKKISSSNEIRNVSAVFSTKDDTVSMKFFEGVKYTVLFGTINSNYSSALIEKDSLIKINNIWGNVNIRLPEGVNVSVTSHSLFGGVDNRIVNNDNNQITVYVQSYSLLGSAEIRN